VRGNVRISREGVSVRDRKVLLSSIFAVALLVFGGRSQTAFAGRPDPVVPLKESQAGFGYDISFPQCTRPFPATPFGFAVVGVTEGVTFSTNDCLHDQFVWAQQATKVAPELYMNLNYVMGVSWRQAMSGPKGNCTRADAACQAYNYGYNAADFAFNYAKQQEATAHMWWVDVEWMNYWSRWTNLNDLTIQGAIDFLASQNVMVGVYSTQLQWNTIAGARFVPSLPNNASLPNWLATGENRNTAPAWCTPNNAFGGGTVWYV
jgi:hypothetical protein